MAIIRSLDYVLIKRFGSHIDAYWRYAILLGLTEFSIDACRVGEVIKVNYSHLCNKEPELVSVADAAIVNSRMYNAACLVGQTLAVQHRTLICDATALDMPSLDIFFGQGNEDLWDSC